MRIILIEGKNREIRRVFSHFHLSPETLRRVRIGSVLLGDLSEGQSRPLSNTEIQALSEKDFTQRRRGAEDAKEENKNKPPRLRASAPPRENFSSNFSNQPSNKSKRENTW